MSNVFFVSYRTMKENIGELLHELDQTRSGDKTWDHNQSFGLHKLLKIVDGESRLVSCTALTLCPLSIRVSNSLDQDLTRHFVGSDLGPNCLPRLSADDTSQQRFKKPGHLKILHTAMS